MISTTFSATATPIYLPPIRCIFPLTAVRSPQTPVFQSCMATRRISSLCVLFHVSVVERVASAHSSVLPEVA